MKSSISAVFLALLVSGAAQAGCVSDDPALVARSFHAGHADFVAENPDNIRHLVTPRLFQVLQREYRCARGEICALEADPWTDAQDGEITRPIRFETRQNDGAHATVTMNYFFLPGNAGRQARVATLKLTHSTISGCWELADLVSPNGVSLLNQLERWHRRPHRKN